MSQATVLHAVHLARGARMVDFGGWQMPLAYGSQIEEHHAVRRDAGMFDVSHMTVLDLQGSGTRPMLRRLLANSVDKLKQPGRALYSCMLNERGGVIDDLIVYFLAEDCFRVVVNAATREKDLAWIETQVRGYDVVLRERQELAMLAVQGPKARERFASLLPAEAAVAALAMPRFSALDLPAPQGMDSSLFVARTGYTGEDGFEILVAEPQAAALWQALEQAGVRPCGLGARDTLRLEAGMALYGQDMDESVSPLEAGLAWCVAFDEGRDFLGRGALMAQRDGGVPRRTVGLVLDAKGVLRRGMVVHAGSGQGAVLSGTHSPTLGRSIALARLPAGDAGQVEVELRAGQRLPVRLVDYPFVREGRARPGILP